MGEIITIQVGKCGNMIGKQFWETICAEHSINKMGVTLGDSDFHLKNVKTYFLEVKGLTFSPRAVLIDLDKSTMDTIRYSPYGQIFKPDNFVFGSDGAGNNWAKGHFSEGADLCGTALNVIRKESEACDYLREFELLHSIGGGTGAGLGSLLLCKLRDEYPNKLISSYSVIPSSKVSDFVVEPYNAVLTLHHLIDNTNKTYCMDNEALYNIVGETLHMKQPNVCEVNSLMACAISGITSCIRFPGQKNVGYKKFEVNAIPFPRLHFFIPGLAPLVGRDSKSKRKYSAGEISSCVFDYQNFLAACDIRKGVFLTATCIFRGKLSTKEVETHMNNMKLKFSSRFVEWIPDNLKLAFCDIPPPGFTEIATTVANTTAVQYLLKQTEYQFQKMFSKRAFLHWYTDEGMDLLEFEAAKAGLQELIEDYQSAGKETLTGLNPTGSCVNET